MCKLLLVLLLGLSIAGCSSTTASRTPTDTDTEQLRRQHMELYRTMESMPQSYPIIILKPTSGQGH